LHRSKTAGNSGQYWGRSNTHQHWFAIWLRFGQKFFNVAFCSYLHLQHFNWAAVPGGRFSNSPTSQSPIVSGYMTRLLIILTILFAIYSCKEQIKPNTKKTEKFINSKKVENFDTLPNGKLLLDTYDSGMVFYYKEVVGSDTLKDGKITCYGIDDSIRYFYLRDGENLHLLNQSTIHQSPWSLGRLEKEFNTFILITLDNGNGCPTSYQIFDKATGNNILGDKIVANGYIFLKDTLFMFYDNWNKNKQADTLTLFNVKTKNREFFKLPNNLPEFCDIQIEKLSKTKLKVTFETFVGDRYEKSKTYSR
jgi:hypothetical protein